MVVEPVYYSEGQAVMTQGENQQANLVFWYEEAMALIQDMLSTFVGKRPKVVGSQAAEEGPDAWVALE